MSWKFKRVKKQYFKQATDTYIVKPFSASNLHARVKALLSGWKNCL